MDNSARLDLLGDSNPNSARRAHRSTEQSVPRGFERALLNRGVEVRELVVAELLEHGREEWERWVRVGLG